MAIIDSLQEIDTRLFHRLFQSGSHWPSIRVAAKIISRSGDGHVHAALFLGIALWQPPGALGFLILFAVAMTVERLVYVLLKHSLKRRRPQDFFPKFSSLVTASDQFSFPSGHTSAAFCLVAITNLAFGTHFAILFMWATAVGISRVLLGVHFPGDILAGATLGTGLALISALQLGLL